MKIETQIAPQGNDESTTAEHTPPAPAGTSTSEDNEFQLTVKKLELPVRPRGVLAE